jgi:hypothetical protein
MEIDKTEHMKWTELGLSSALTLPNATVISCKYSQSQNKRKCGGPWPPDGSISLKMPDCTECTGCNTPRILGKLGQTVGIVSNMSSTARYLEHPRSGVNMILSVLGQFFRLVWHGVT